MTHDEGQSVRSGLSAFLLGCHLPNSIGVINPKAHQLVDPTQASTIMWKVSNHLLRFYALSSMQGCSFVPGIQGICT